MPGRSDIDLRAVEPADGSFLRRLYASSRADLALLDWSADQLEAFLEMQYSARECHYREWFPAADDLVVLCDDQRAGRLRIERSVGEIRIVDIALLPERRGSGIGTALIAGLQAEASAAGRPLALQVEAGSPAVNLYRRLGFISDAGDGVYDALRWLPQPVAAGSAR